LDSEWRDRAGLNGCGPAEASYMKHRTEGHTQTEISGDTRADWSEAFALVAEPRGRLRLARIEVHARGSRWLLRIGFLHHSRYLEQGTDCAHENALLVQHEPCWYVRKKNAPWYGKPGENSTIWDSPSPKFIMGGSDEGEARSSTAETRRPDAAPDSDHTKLGELVYEPFLGSGDDARRGG